MVETRDRSTPTPGDEPVAIVGMACRLPGAADLAAFWDLLRHGADGIDDGIPARLRSENWTRLREVLRRSGTDRVGGFLERVDEFDADFFGFSERETVRMSPAHRLLFEVVWEALEDAGVPTADLAGSRTAVFSTALLTPEYWYALDRDDMCDLYAISGAAISSTAAGRISFELDLRGPHVAVDAACASSLLAVHMACASIRSGESSSAIVSSVNLQLGASYTTAMARGKVISPTGAVKFGDHKADGYVRSDGAVAVLLKPLSTALADGDRIYATILGSGVSSPGRTARTMVSPSVPAQLEAITTAHAQAGVGIADIDYVEAHGSGTVRGDHAELSALGELVRGERDVDDPCLTGSVKSNIGHTEASAGLAGLVKTALAMRHGTIPPTLHVAAPNEILADDLPLSLVRQARPWPARGPRRVAGISSFGMSGTNVHLVVASAKDAGRSPARTTPSHAYLLPLSARTPGAAAQLAGAFACRLDQIGSVGELRDVVFSAGARRTHHDHRVAVVGRSRAELVDGLRGYAAGRTPASVVASVAVGPRPVDEPLRTVFVCDGPGTRWPGLGPALFVTNPVFLQRMQECDKAVAAELGWSVLDRLADRPPEGGYDALPLEWATQVGLAAMWRSWGVEPDLVLGHHGGGLAAATIRGDLSLGEAAGLLAGGGRMPGPAPVSLTEYAEFAGDGLPTLFVELGTGDGLTSALGTALDDAGLLGSAHAVASLPTGVAEPHGMLTVLAEAYVRGAEVDWGAVNPGGRYVPLPGYPWQRRRYWTDSLVGSTAR